MDIKKISGFLLRGFLPELTPSIVRGLLIEHLQKVDIKELSRWIDEDVSLWDKIAPEYHEDIKRFVSGLGDIGWFNYEWLEEGLRKDLPILCSLFMGDESARNWLEMQLDDIKKRLMSPVS
jgi:hypothetical protein